MNRSTLPPLEDDFTRALLRSAERDEPSSAAYSKAATALGVGAGLGVGASLAAPSVVAAGAAAAARWSASTALRLWAFGVSGALLVGGGALLLSGQASGARQNSKQGLALHAGTLSKPPSSASPLSGADALPVHGSAAPDPATVSPTVAPSLTQVPSSVLSVSAGPSRAGSSVVRRVARPVQAASGSSLSEQVQSLDRARVALGSGDAGTALSEIARYRKAWPSGVFLTEASVLEIEALAARGERSLAAARAAAFVAAQPDSPQAERLRRLVSLQKP